MKNIGVIGAGAFGTALACVLAKGDNRVALWGRNVEQMDAMSTGRVNAAYLPDVSLPKALQITSNLSDLTNSDVLLMVVPAQVSRSVIQSDTFKDLSCPVLMCAKGIELNTSRSQTDILAEEQPDLTFGAISGPGFAAEIANGKPTALTLGMVDPILGSELQKLLSTTTLRMYLSHDVLGVQLGGALKNVYAIACGIVNGSNLGESAQAALLTRGFVELKTLAHKMGAQPETLSGLSGFGDMVLSCTSMQSRNFAFGHQVGSQARLGQTKTVEGISTSLAVGALAEKHGLEMPICKAVSAVLQEKLSVTDALAQLMSRPLKHEV